MSGRSNLSFYSLALAALAVLPATFRAGVFLAADFAGAFRAAVFALDFAVFLAAVFAPFGADAFLAAGEAGTLGLAGADFALFVALTFFSTRAFALRSLASSRSQDFVSRAISFSPAFLYAANSLSMAFSPAETKDLFAATSMRVSTGREKGFLALYCAPSPSQN